MYPFMKQTISMVFPVFLQAEIHHYLFPSEEMSEVCWQDPPPKKLYGPEKIDVLTNKQHETGGKWETTPFPTQPTDLAKS